MEMIRLEIICSVQLDGSDVMEFIQEIPFIPTDATCELDRILSTKVPSQHQPNGSRASHNNVSSIHNCIYLKCEPQVAAFLCNKFGRQVRHVSKGEILMVRCKRDHITVTSTSGSQYQTRDKTQTNSEYSDKKQEVSTLPMNKVVELLDFLGGHVVQVRDVYVRNAGDGKLSLLGTVKALESLCGDQWKVPNQDNKKVTLNKVRHLIHQLIESRDVSFRELPTSPTEECLNYTDFLSCYVSFISTNNALLPNKPF